MLPASCRNSQPPTPWSSRVEYVTLNLPNDFVLTLTRQITPTQFLDTINTINEILISAHSLRHSFVDNALSFFTLQISRLVLTPHYEKVSGCQ